MNEYIAQAIAYIIFYVIGLVTGFELRWIIKRIKQAIRYCKEKYEQMK